MKLANANLYRAETVAEIMAYFTSKGEDCGMITSNTFNMPIVVNGEEGFAEITVKVTKDTGDDGYLKRDAYTLALAEKAEKAKAAAEKKAKKIAADAKRREELKAKANAK